MRAPFFGLRGLGNRGAVREPAKRKRFGDVVAECAGISRKIDGTVEELLPNMHFRVVLQNGMNVIAHLCGKMRMRNIRVLVGDTVTVEMSPYDLTKARIIYRMK